MTPSPQVSGASSQDQPATPHYDKLKGKQRAFVDNYMIDMNATQAAIKAGYSAAAASEMGYENLRKPHIALAVEELTRMRSNISRVWIIDELAKIARANIGDIMDVENGAAMRGISRDMLSAVSSVKITSGKVEAIEVKMHDKLAALTKLGQALGIKFTEEKAALTGDVTNNYFIALPQAPTELSDEEWGDRVRQRHATEALEHQPAKPAAVKALPKRAA